MKAWKGALPPGAKGYEFTTPVKPSSDSAAWAYWYEGTPGVRLEDGKAKIPVTVTKVVQ